MFYYENVPRWMREIPRHLKTQEMYEEAVWIKPHSLVLVPDFLRQKAYALQQLEEILTHLIACPITDRHKKICNEAMPKNPAALFLYLTVLNTRNV